MRASTLEKQKKITQVATALFLKQGYKDTALDQIVQQCGGSKQTLYRYFGCKEGLFEHVLNENAKSLETVFDFTDKLEMPVVECLEQFGREYLKRTCSNPIIGLFRIVSADFNQHRQVADTFWQQGPNRVHNLLVEYLQSEPVAQLLDIQDSKQACSQLLALIKLDYFNTALLGQALPDDDAIAQHIQQAVSAFMQIYQAR